MNIGLKLANFYPQYRASTANILAVSIAVKFPVSTQYNVTRQFSIGKFVKLAVYSTRRIKKV